MPLFTIISEPCSFKRIWDGEGYSECGSAKDTRLGFIHASCSQCGNGLAFLKADGKFLPQDLRDMRSDDMLWLCDGVELQYRVVETIHSHE